MSKCRTAIGILVGLVVLGSASAIADESFDQLVQKGMQLYQVHDNVQSVATFEEALKVAKPGSEEEFTAARNILMPLADMGDRDRLWQAKRRVALLDHQLHGTAIPDEFKADAQTAATGSKAPTPPPSVSASPAGQDEAIKLYSAGKYAPAMQKLESIKRAGNADAQTHLYLGSCCQALKKYKLALVEYDWLAKNSPLISLKRKGTDSARHLRDAMAGVCPGDCLRLSMPGWRHEQGDPPNVLRLRFPYQNGTRGYMAFSSNHLGDVVKYKNGVPEDIGKCPICGGTGHVEPLK
ncbi:MAG TPA: hypothetical protein V6D22_09640 [Candidatus Obscuribacterales bacterium]